MTMKPILSISIGLLLLSGVHCAYDYAEAIHASLLFYEAQRSGALPANNRISWRGDSMLNDGKDVGLDLTGGYFDAGDFVKFGFPMAFTITTLAWGVVDYADAYEKAGELENALAAIKWGTDYFIKCHTDENTFYGQVGNGNADHAIWDRPENWDANQPQRPAYKITSAHGGSDLAGETAAALAAASIAFQSSDSSYSATLLEHAKSLYEFANNYRDTYTTEITDAVSFYMSFSGYGDELAWAAAWLLRATDDNYYQTQIDSHLSEFQLLLTGRSGGFGWDDKVAGFQVLMAQVTGEEKYKTMAQTFCDWLINEVPKTPKGLAFLGEWGSLRSAAGASLICLQAAQLGIKTDEYISFAEGQIGYILGDTGRSFVVGFGVNPPERPHHRSSSCPDPPEACYFDSSSNPNPHTLTGALVGGPGEDDSYNDSRDDYVHNEVADDYNAGFQTALAALLHLQN